MSPELIFAAGVAGIAFLVGVLYLRARARRTRSVGLHVASGPANMRFTCAGCSGKFTHNRRTLGAWEKGSRAFYCNACHTKWRGHPPPKPGQMVPVRAQKKGGAGCLGLALLLLAVPGVALLGAVVGAVRYLA